MTINWVPGHKGYEGNERADHQAQLGCLKIPTYPVYNKIPFHNLENKIEEYYQKSIINRYKYSYISCEAKIIKYELPKATKTIQAAWQLYHILFIIYFVLWRVKFGGFSEIPPYFRPIIFTHHDKNPTS